MIARSIQVLLGSNPKPKGALVCLLKIGILIGKIIGLILLWQGFSLLEFSVFLPSPAQVWAAFWRLTLQGDVQGYILPQQVWTSLIRVLSGFGLAVLTGIPVGIIFGLWNRIYEFFKLVVEPVRFIPPLAWVPLAIIFLRGESRYTFIIWLGAVFPILITTMSGIKALDSSFWEVGRVLGANRWQAVVKIAIPSAAPHILDGARLGLGTAWACIVAAEMVGGGATGLGCMIINYGQLLQIDAVVVGMIVIGILGYLFNELFVIAERRVFPWRRAVKF